MKTRKEILEADQDSALAQIIENEINIRNLEKKVILTPPGADYNEIQKAINVRKANIEQIKKVLVTIGEMIDEESKKKEGMA